MDQGWDSTSFSCNDLGEIAVERHHGELFPLGHGQDLAIRRSCHAELADVRHDHTVLPEIFGRPAG